MESLLQGNNNKLLVKLLWVLAVKNIYNYFKGPFCFSLLN